MQLFYYHLFPSKSGFRALISWLNDWNWYFGLFWYSPHCKLQIALKLIITTATDRKIDPIHALKSVVRVEFLPVQPAGPLQTVEKCVAPASNTSAQEGARACFWSSMDGLLFIFLSLRTSVTKRTPKTFFLVKSFVQLVGVQH